MEKKNKKKTCLSITNIRHFFFSFLKSYIGSNYISNALKTTYKKCQYFLYETTGYPEPTAMGKILSRLNKFFMSFQVF